MDVLHVFGTTDQLTKHHIGRGSFEQGADFTLGPTLGEPNHLERKVGGPCPRHSEPPSNFGQPNQVNFADHWFQRLALLFGQSACVEATQHNFVFSPDLFEKVKQTQLVSFL